MFDLPVLPTVMGEDNRYNRSLAMEERARLLQCREDEDRDIEGEIVWLAKEFPYYAKLSYDCMLDRITYLENTIKEIKENEDVSAIH